MNIPERQIEPLTAFGYTVSEAVFLYIVSLHSGYFTARHFSWPLSNASLAIERHSAGAEVITRVHSPSRIQVSTGGGGVVFFFFVFFFCIYHLYSRRALRPLVH